MTGGELLTITLIVLVPAALLWVVFLARTGRPGGPQRLKIGIPQAMRPGTPDDVLESSRLERLLKWGLIASLVSAVFIPVYWLPEP
ncbi:MAG TPA: hypothetical protein VG106_02480, partial [Vicinamibacterales bacterium]|nr:hypothetical protein [Vicinamibacterales bacterium]